MLICTILLSGNRLKYLHSWWSWDRRAPGRSSRVCSCTWNEDRQVWGDSHRKGGTCPHPPGHTTAETRTNTLQREAVQFPRPRNGRGEWNCHFHMRTVSVHLWHVSDFNTHTQVISHTDKRIKNQTPEKARWWFLIVQPWPKLSQKASGFSQDTEHWTGRQQQENENNSLSITNSPKLPPNMISQQGHIETQCEPLCCTEKHDTEECMDEVLWKYKLKKKKWVRSFNYTEWNVAFQLLWRHTIASKYYLKPTLTTTRLWNVKAAASTMCLAVFTRYSWTKETNL